jgi:hypothetical protein
MTAPVRLWPQELDKQAALLADQQRFCPPLASAIAVGGCFVRSRSSRRRELPGLFVRKAVWREDLQRPSLSPFGDTDRNWVATGTGRPTMYAVLLSLPPLAGRVSAARTLLCNTGGCYTT